MGQEKKEQVKIRQTKNLNRLERGLEETGLRKLIDPHSMTVGEMRSRFLIGINDLVHFGEYCLNGFQDPVRSYFSIKSGDHMNRCREYIETTEMARPYLDIYTVLWEPDSTEENLKGELENLEQKYRGYEMQKLPESELNEGSYLYQPIGRGSESRSVYVPQREDEDSDTNSSADMNALFREMREFEHGMHIARYH